MESRKRILGIYKLNFYECLSDPKFEGVFCLDTAAGYHFLSTYNYEFNLNMLTVMTDKDCQYKMLTGGELCWCGIDKIDYSHCIEIKPNLYVMDIPLTICQVILFDCWLFHLCESIFSLYENFTEHVPETEKLAKSYGIYGRLQELKSEAYLAYEEDNC